MTPAAVGTTGLGVNIDGRTILSAIDLAVAPGEWLGVIGPNGAGKTTLLRCLSGSQAHSGDVMVAGRATAGLGQAERARLVAVVPQHPQLPAGMSVAEYVLLGRTPHIALFAFESRRDRSVVADLLDQLGLAEMARRPVTTLSGGERQRAVVARALAQEPALLLLDEPTTALDLGHQHEVLGLVDDLRVDHNLTVISALHDLTLAGQYADRFLLLHEGHQVAVGPAAEVLTPVLLERCYGTRVEVHDHGDTLVVVPPRPRPRRRRPEAAAEETVRPG
jgi:iron complex transport system ATP-binding protein